MQQAELIIAYLKGELPEGQRQEFETRLAADPEWRAAVNDYRTILQGFKGLRHEATRQEIAGWSLADDPDEEEILIMAYVEGQMEPASRKAFEHTMAGDPALREKVDNQLAIIQGFKGLQHDAFAEEVSQWAKALPGAAAKPEARVVPLRRRSGFWRYGAAAAVLILMVAAFWLLGPGGGDDFNYTAFIQENYIAPVDPSDRGDNQSVLIGAVQDFNRGNYPAAIEKLRTISSEDSLYVLARYWLGHSLYQAKQYAAAIEAFGQSLTPPTGNTYDLGTFSRDNAAWSRILAQLALWDENSAPEIGQQLQTFLNDFLETADRSDAYYAKGLELQENLESAGK